MFKEFTRRDQKNRYGIHICDLCGREYERRIRADRIHDNCGCTPVALKHGHERGRKKSPELMCWRKLQDRCYRSKDKEYHCYGGRGITVCERWRASFQAFLDDMGPRPSPNHSIDRIDVNGPYSPENCRWATRYVQARNTTFNIHIEIDGRCEILHDWFKILNVAKTTYYRHVGKFPSPKDCLIALIEDNHG